MRMQRFLGPLSLLICSLLLPAPSRSQAPATDTPAAGAAGADDGQSPARLGRQSWRNLSPEDRRARMQKFMQNRRGGSGWQSRSGTDPAEGSPHRPGRGGRSGGTPLDTEHVALKSDVAYGSDPLQKMDVYTPKAPSSKPLPMLIFFHGGGWARGDKAMGDHGGKGNSYCAKNIVFVSANYRLAPAVVHPAQVQDVAEAVKYMREHAAEFNGDPHRIYIMGHSAGAQLVDLLGTNDKYLKEKGLSLADLRGVISLDTASLNLSERLDDKSAEIGLIGPMIDGAFGSDPKVLADASPALNIHRGKSYPPFLMVCSSKRPPSMSQHDKFAAALKAAGGKVVVKPVPLSHGDINRVAGQADSDVFKEIVEMIGPAK